MTTKSNPPLPVVSILIPTYNRATFLESAIKSALAQTYSNLNVIISDNCSTDATPSIVTAFLEDKRVTYRRKKSNIGMVANWKSLLYDDKIGDYFVLLSDDDYLIDDIYIEKAVDLLLSNPNVCMVFGNGYLENSSSGQRERLDLGYSVLESGPELLLKSSTAKPQAFTLCNIVFNTNIAQNTGAFENPLNLYCDSELFLKSCIYGDVGYIDTLSSVYQFHGGNLVTQQRSPEEVYAISIDLFVRIFNLILDSPRFRLRDKQYYKKHIFEPAVKSHIVYLRSTSRSYYRMLVSALRPTCPRIGIMLLTDPIFMIRFIISICPPLLRLKVFLKSGATKLKFY